jgi:hypothetical protein
LAYLVWVGTTPVSYRNYLSDEALMRWWVKAALVAVALILPATALVAIVIGRASPRDFIAAVVVAIIGLFGDVF